jgi:hypothetical protein
MASKPASNVKKIYFRILIPTDCFSARSMSNTEAARDWIFETNRPASFAEAGHAPYATGFGTLLMVFRMRDTIW